MADQADSKIPEAEVKAEENGQVEKSEEVKAESGDKVDDSKLEVKAEAEDAKERKPRRYSNGMLKTTAVEEQDKKKNSKYDASLVPKPESKEKLPARIRGQVEFYFSDSNLPTDDYLWGLTDGASNKPVPLEDIMRFGRMKIYDYADVVPALKESAFLNITGEEGKEKVNRKIAFDPTAEKKAQEEKEARSVYVKGFGDEVPTSQFDIEAFFTPYGPTNAVRLRRTTEKLFKGSVFVEFESEEVAKKFLELDPKPLWKGENILKIMSKKDYVTLKEQEIKDGKIQPSESFAPRRGRRGFRGDRGRGRGGGNRDRGDRDPDDWKKRREEDRANGFRDDRKGRGRGRGGRRDEKKNDRKRNRDDNDEESAAKKVKSENTESETKPEVKPEVIEKPTAEA